MTADQHQVAQDEHWAYRLVTDWTQWCFQCLHNTGAYVIPYLLTTSGVTRYNKRFRCRNCGNWGLAKDNHD